MTTSFLGRLRNLMPGRGRQMERDMLEELESLKQFAQPGELGSLSAAAENAREVTGFPWLRAIGSDVRYSLRGLRRERGFTVVAVASLAVGIAGNIAIFSLMDTLLWRELPVRGAGQLVAFENTSRSYFGYSEFARNSGAAMQDVVAQSSESDVTVNLGAEEKQAQVQFVSANYFSALGVKPVCGQMAGGVVLGYRYWRNAFHGDRSVAGRRLRVGKATFQIAGVAPREFAGLWVGEAPDFWLPITAYDLVFPGGNWLAGRNNNWLTIIGRLRDGVTPRRAEAMLTPVSIEIDIVRNKAVPSARLRREMMEDPVRLVPIPNGLSDLRESFEKPLTVVFAMLGIGLFLSCGNVVSLQLARADKRRKEFFTRLAIGASRFRILRQCFMEALVLAGISGVLGFLLFRPAAAAIVSLMTMWNGQPAQLDLGLHPRVIAFVVLTCLTVALVSGLLPAFYSARMHNQQRIAGARNARGLMRFVGIVQFAVSVVMITGMCLLAFSLHQLRSFDTGVRREGLLELTVNPLNAGFKGESAVRLDQRLCDRLSAIPGVTRATFSQLGVYSDGSMESNVEADGNQHAVHGEYDRVGPGFFTTIGTALVAGRDFNADDDAAGPRVAIINQTFASRVFPGGALGRSIYVDEGEGKISYRVVGVVRDLRSRVRSGGLMWFVPEMQGKEHFFSSRLLIRTNRQQQMILHEAEAAVKAESSQLRVDNFSSGDELFDRTIGMDRLMARLALALGLMAVSLASVGIYGLISYDVARRTGEIGIRAALGARPRDIVLLVLADVAMVAVTGMFLGGCLAAALAGFVRGLVFGLKVNDPLFEVAGAAILLAVALAAAVIPARRAVRLDPVRALRLE